MQNAKYKMDFKTLYSKLLEDTIRNELLNILNLVKYLYPDKISDDKYNEIKKELDTIILKKHNSIKKNSFKTKIHNNIIKRKFVNNGLKIPTLKNNMINHKKRGRSLPEQDMRCIARVWSNGKIIRKGDEIIFGTQCTRPKAGSSNYCFQHNKHNPHNDFDKDPNLKLLVNFKKHSKSKNVKKLDELIPRH